MPVGLSLIYDPGMRPGSDEVERLGLIADGNLPPFTVSHRPSRGGSLGRAAGHDWLELLSCGLTYDVSGLSAGPGQDLPSVVHGFGIARDACDDGECLRLCPGPHLSGGHALVPVVRTLMAVAARLAAGSGFRAVVWHPARSVIEAGVFRRLVTAWLEGGPFPALGLTALVHDADGGLRSEGLSFFTGQELRIEPLHHASGADRAKLAVRLIDALVQRGPVATPFEMTLPDGDRLRLEPSANQRFVRVWSDGR